MCVIGSVYKICHTQSDVVYVGSTFATLRERFRMHKRTTVQNGCSITPLLIEHGPDQFKIILIKKYEVCDRKHLEAYEQLWINKLKCINKRCSLQLISHKEQMRRWYIKNRDRTLAQQKQYAIEHIDQRREYSKQYMEAHKDSIQAYRASYNQKKWECEICSCSINLTSKYNHIKSAKHRSHLQSV